MFVFFFSSRRRHTSCALVTGVQTCALPILQGHGSGRGGAARRRARRRLRSCGEPLVQERLPPRASRDPGTAIGLAASDAWVKERDPVQIGTTHIHHHGRISIAPSAYPSPPTHNRHPKRTKGTASLQGTAAPPPPPGVVR